MPRIQKRSSDGSLLCIMRHMMKERDGGVGLFHISFSQGKGGVSGVRF